MGTPYSASIGGRAAHVVFPAERTNQFCTDPRCQLVDCGFYLSGQGLVGAIELFYMSGGNREPRTSVRSRCSLAGRQVELSFRRMMDTSDSGFGRTLLRPENMRPLPPAVKVSTPSTCFPPCTFRDDVSDDDVGRTRALKPMAFHKGFFCRRFLCLPDVSHLLCEVS